MDEKQLLENGIVFHGGGSFPGNRAAESRYPAIASSVP
jgi:isopentenyl phosphate kinase